MRDRSIKTISRTTANKANSIYSKMRFRYENMHVWIHARGLENIFIELFPNIVTQSHASPAFMEKIDSCKFWFLFYKCNSWFLIHKTFTAKHITVRRFILVSTRREYFEISSAELTLTLKSHNHWFCFILHFKKGNEHEMPITFTTKYGKWV